MTAGLEEVSGGQTASDDDIGLKVVGEEFGLNCYGGHSVYPSATTGLAGLPGERGPRASYILLFPIHVFVFSSPQSMLSTLPCVRNQPCLLPSPL